LKPVDGQPGYYIFSVSLLALVVGTTARLLVVHKWCLSLVAHKKRKMANDVMLTSPSITFNFRYQGYEVNNTSPVKTVIQIRPHFKQYFEF
jgi:hypothetical protein